MPEPTKELREFFKDDSLIQPKIIPTRHDLKNGRWYEYEGKFKPSVTTFLDIVSKGIGFNMWLGNSPSYREAMKIRDEAGEVGERIHYNIGNLILGGEVETVDRPEAEIKMLLGFMKFWEDYEPRPIAVEVPLYHPDIPYAGTADLICNIKVPGLTTKEDKWLIDFKTGQLYDIHQVQLSAYKILAEKIFNFKIDNIRVLRLYEHRGDKPNYQLKPFDPLSPDFINSIYSLWQWDRKNPEPVFQVEYPEVLSLQEKENEPKT